MFKKITGTYYISHKNCQQCQFALVVDTVDTLANFENVNAGNLLVHGLGKSIPRYVPSYRIDVPELGKFNSNRVPYRTG